MITCLLADHLPAIHCSSAKTRSAGSRTLTEVVCVALYGSPLKPGSDHGSLKEALQPLILEGRALWKNPNGPGWLVPHLELIADGKSWTFRPDTDDESKKITLDAFRAAKRWLSRSRRMGFVYGLPAVLAEKVLSLANMSERDAIRAVLAEADRIERSEAAINAKAAEFYKLLSDAVAARQITLKAIATDPRTNAWLPRTRGEPPHQSIPTDYFELPMVHNLFDNDLEADHFSTEAKLLDSIFNRIERENEGLLIKWSDVKIPPEHVSWLLSTFRRENGAKGTSVNADVRTMVAAEQERRRQEQVAAEERELGFNTLPSEIGEAVHRLSDRLRDRGIEHIRIALAIRLVLAARKGSRELLSDTHYFLDLSISIDKALARFRYVAARRPVGRVADAFARGEVPTYGELLEPVREFAASDCEPVQRDAASQLVGLLARRLEVGDIENEFLLMARDGKLTLWGREKSPSGIGTMAAVPRDYFRHPRTSNLHENVLASVPASSTASPGPVNTSWVSVEMEKAVLARLLGGAAEAGDQQALASVAKDKQAQAPTSKVRRGRTKGSGSFKHLDEPLLDEMEQLIQHGRAVSPEAASHLVAEKASGHGTIESKAERLANPTASGRISPSA